MITNKELLQKSEQLNNLDLTKWFNQELFSLPWFVTFFIVLVCYVLFFYLVDKKRIVEILLYGSFVAVLFVVYDSFGNFFGYWTDLITVVPFSPNFFGDSFTVVPLISMLIYQYTSSWKSFIISYIVFSTVLEFGYYNYLLEKLDVYTFLKPEPFLILIDYIAIILIGVIPRLVTIYLFKIEERNRNH
ncbi:hypothetical protein CFK37_00030 [Virgibacillus phasianinus]|uniref:Uncharacterized protein n=1 Tax=Virgibacillus phasianinus TaxID=2017483 RepID=A0A220TXX8_9BACI|nr:hypothetical protein [Virgibacillus phasianinus]ASK60708.1 hypothetical protein CFK37_00030 [Virgibacillus phasianinus]